MPLQQRRKKNKTRMEQLVLVTAAIVALTALAQLVGAIIILIH